ncbi:MAG: hypothetical protein M3N23_10495 [Pseudomonadota bacterium]|nr:hypothetical protein [Pseudomonadota bacterium]
MKITLRSVVASAFACAPLTAFACSSCGCTLTGDWDSQGFTAAPGLRLELRHDFLNQSQLRTGTGTVSRNAISLPADREIEQGTINRYTTLAVDYSPNADWGVTLQLPYVDRSHSTVSPGDTDVSTSHSQSLGDARLIARYQGFTPQHQVGVQVGLKLATGAHDQQFDGGPQQGQALDRGLQAGSGSTDLLLGGFYVGNLAASVDYFTQAMVQLPMHRLESYRPGRSLNLNLGVRYVGSQRLTPELQFNARTVQRDTGDQADTENSGGTLLYVAPGATFAFSDQLNLFGFVQIPLYQHFNGFQLAPRFIASIGARYAF